MIAYVLVVAGVTLWPVEPLPVDPPTLCLLCGDRGLADAILNVVLFLPIGLLLSGRRWPVALLVAGIGSASIELLQLVVPGRHPTPSDVLFNALGAAAGVQLGRISRYWVHPSQYFGDRMATVAAVLAVATMPLTGWLTEQQLPEPPYRVEWEASTPELRPYPGRVLQAGIQPLRLTPGPSGRGEVAKALLERGALMGVRAETGPPPDGLAQLLAFYDRDRTLVALLGVDGTDVVYLESTRAARLRLDNPDIRERDALAGVEPGDTIQIATGQPGSRRCFLVGESLSCRYSITGDSGWRLLYAMNGAAPELLAAVSALWLALLLFPVGYWARWHLALALTAGFVVFAWFRVPSEAGLAAVPPVELAGAVSGVVLGLLVRRGVRRHREATGP